jgi:hypothetical protein
MRHSVDEWVHSESVIRGMVLKEPIAHVHVHGPFIDSNLEACSLINARTMSGERVSDLRGSQPHGPGDQVQSLVEVL